MKLTGLIGGALILVLFVLSGAEGAKWQYVDTDALGSKWYIDINSITEQSGDIVTAWLKCIYSDKGRIEHVSTWGPEYKDLAQTKSFFEYNCATKESRITTFTTYDSQNKVIDKQVIKERRWIPLPPQTVTDGIHKIVCPK